MPTLILTIQQTAQLGETNSIEDSTSSLSLIWKSELLSEK